MVGVNGTESLGENVPDAGEVGEGYMDAGVQVASNAAIDIPLEALAVEFAELSRIEDGVNGRALGRCQVCLAPALKERCRDCLKGIEPRAEFVEIRQGYVSRGTNCSSS